MEVKEIFITKEATIKHALKQLDKTAEKVLLVVDEMGRLCGSLTDGDIRRAVLKGKDFSDTIDKVCNPRPLCLQRGSYSSEKAQQLFLQSKVNLIPIVNDEGLPDGFITWDQVFGNALSGPQSRHAKLALPVVLMAGGKGLRLEPFTKIIPKPLIPIGDKPILELVIEEFKTQGVEDFFVTLNHKGEMIQAYFDSIEKDYNIQYVWEKGCLGTAGSLRLIKEKLSGTFIVSNSDVIVKAHFAEVISFHREHKAALTLLSSLQHHKIPYGVVHFGENGVVSDIAEKPEYTFVVNAGVYVLERLALEFIPDGRAFDMTDLIKALIAAGKTVLTYPVNESDYIDIGQWEEYKKATDRLKLLI